MTAEIRPISTDQLADRFAAMEHALRAPRLEWARDLWAGYKRGAAGSTQHAYLKGVCDLLEARNITRTPERLYSYLYAGCAQAHGFHVVNIAEGESIGKALDRLGLDVATVRAHLDAGTLEQAIQGNRSPTTSVRVTRDAQAALDSAATMARETLQVEGLSEPEVRAIYPKAWEHAPPELRRFLLRLGNGDVDLSRIYLVESDERPTGTTLRNAAPPMSFPEWAKNYGTCWVCGEPTAGRETHMHHVRTGEHEARRRDGGAETLVPVHARCHIPQPFSPVTTAHSREFAVGQDAHALTRLIEYVSTAYTAYGRYIRGEA